MTNIYAKLRQREKNKYRKVLSTSEAVYQSIESMMPSKIPYTPGAILDMGEWFYVDLASEQKYALDIFTKDFESVDFELLKRDDFSKIDFVFTEIETNLYFQNISKSRLISKRHLWAFGEHFEYRDNCYDIVLNDWPDAVYSKEKDILYFRRLESISSVFKGIDQLYREATEEETVLFLNNGFITMCNGYSSASVKTANRKRIALAQQTLARLNENDKKNIYLYISEYCPNLRTSDNTFKVGSEDDLKLVLYGIEQRFYTTPVGGEKRIANSVISLK